MRPPMNDAATLGSIGLSVAGRRRFRALLLAWQARHGRHDLPWQREPTPYRIWISEIMLQQTQVGTVIPYYRRFLERFPSLNHLAGADLDEVLHLWTGLGYYARARNLHRAARLIVSEPGGCFPCTREAVERLPGIGRSTAGAILALAFGERHAILDGNVQRVLARLFALDADSRQAATRRTLWDLAEQLTPHTRLAQYTQAIMDLGATLCTPRTPDCARCPVATLCVAHRKGRPDDYPRKPVRRDLPVRATRMIMILNGRSEVLLLQRPPAGLWGGLWGFPECAPDAEPVAHCREHLGLEIIADPPWPVRRHAFSHYRLDITPVPAILAGACDAVMENPAALWYKPDYPVACGLAAPVRQLLDTLRKNGWHAW